MKQEILDNVTILFCERGIVDQLPVEKAVEKQENKERIWLRTTVLIYI